MGYQIEDSSGDVVVLADADAADAALVDLARGIGAVQTNGSDVRADTQRTVDVTGRDPAAVLVAFANDVIYAFEADGFLTARGDLTFDEDAEPARVHGVLAGEAFDPERHGRGVEVKAATFHDLRFERTEGVWRLRLLLDL